MELPPLTMDEAFAILEAVALVWVVVWGVVIVKRLVSTL